MHINHIASYFALKIEDMERTPGLLNSINAPICVIGLIIILLLLVTITFGDENSLKGKLLPVVKSAALLYGGTCFVIMAIICTRVFCVIVDADDLTAKDMERCRAMQLGWLFEIAMVWGIGGVLIGFASLIKAFRKKSRPVNSDR